MSSLNLTEKAILTFFFTNYPNMVKRSTLKTRFKDLQDFSAELAYLVEKKLVQESAIPSEGKWTGRFERIAAMEYKNPRDAFSGKAYQITATGIDLLKESVHTKGKGALSRQQITEAVPLPASKQICPHRRKGLVDIQPGSAQLVGGGIHVIKGAKPEGMPEGIIA